MTVLAPRELSRPRRGTVSHWQALHGRYSAGTAHVPATADVVVTGGGVIGIAVAYWLARRGVRPLVLEVDDIAAGASGRNAGLVLAGRSQLEDPRLLRAVLQEEELDVGYAEHGHLALAASATVLAAFKTEAAGRPAGAPPLAVLDRADCEDLLGLELAPRFCGGRWLPGAASVDPVAAVHGLADAAVRRGAAIVTAEVRSLEPRAAGGVRVTTDRGDVDAGVAVVACGIGAARLVPLAGALTAHEAQMLATEPAQRVFTIGLAVDWGSTYWRQTHDGVIILGGSAPLTGFLGDAFPSLSVPAIARRWTGVMDVTADGQPLVGRWPAASDRWLAAGFGGHGLPPALGVGRALAESILDGREVPELARFAPGRVLKAAR
ncbi:MAG: NAD(P)/FAD-dependent oxidoreductase [Gaiellaceae bacterium]